MTKTGKRIHLGISEKISVAGLTFIGLILLTIYAWLIPVAEKAILDRKLEKIKEVTETAWSVMQYYQSRVESNNISLQEAQQRAAAIIRNMRYGPEMKDYFWINDMRPYMIMHPYRPSLEGESLEDFKDPDGVALFVEVVRKCREQGAGFIRYSWQRNDDESNIVPKISYVRLYRPWQWIVGTGMYLEDVRKKIEKWRIRVIIVSIPVIFLILILSRRIGLEVAKRERSLSGRDRDFRYETNKTWQIQSIVMLIIVPALALITLFWGVRFYNDLTSIIIEGFDRKLAAISSTAGSFIRGEDHDNIIKTADENDHLYRKYVEPMQRIRERTGLTYLYTQVLINEKPYCNYVLDSSIDADHTAIGYKDELPPADYLGSENVLLYGVVHIGDVEPTEDWGLIKVSYAPIYHDDDSITAIAGADVNISAINDKTRVALFAVGLLAVCAACGIAYITLLFSQRFRRPITELRDAALMIASGNHDYHVDVREPWELRRLSAAFTSIGDTLKNTLRDLRITDQKIIEDNIRHDLLVSMDKPWNYSDSDTKPAAAWLNSTADKKTSSGVVAGRSNTIAWLGHSLPAFDALRQRCEIAASMSRMAESPSVNCLNIVEKAGKNIVRATFIAGETGVYAYIYEPVDILTVGSNGRLDRHSLEKNCTLKTLKCDWLIVSDVPELIWQYAASSITETVDKSSCSACDIINVIEASMTVGAPADQFFVSVLEIQP